MNFHRILHQCAAVNKAQFFSEYTSFTGASGDVDEELSLA